LLTRLTDDDEALCDRGVACRMQNAVPSRLAENFFESKEAEDSVLEERRTVESQDASV
jgi:hypothetical protein